MVRPQLRALTSFRFFACLAVFLHHCVDFTSSGPDSHASGLNRLFWRRLYRIAETRYSLT